MKKILLDTCILIDYFRGKENAVSYLENLPCTPYLSAASIAELYAGVREGKERHLLDTLVRYWQIIPLSTEIAQAGGQYRRDYFKSSGVGLIDGIIAATAIREKATLVTVNIKHFPMVELLVRPY